MKRNIGLVLLIGVMLVSSGCVTTEIKYVMQNNSEYTLVLTPASPDQQQGTYLLNQGKDNTDIGMYRIANDTLYLNIKGFTLSAKMIDDGFIDPDGELWVKK